ncbi:MAG: hypothetical protein IKG44_08370 [Mogibacterium sp.]|nr:hypothetical protein [Mogibacterium sp.]
MTKAEITADLKRFCGGSFITRVELAKYMGYSSPKCVDQILNGLERINGTRYFCNDVAENVLKFKS